MYFSWLVCIIYLNQLVHSGYHLMVFRGATRDCLYQCKGKQHKCGYIYSYLGELTSWQTWVGFEMSYVRTWVRRQVNIGWYLQTTQGRKRLKASDTGSVYYTVLYSVTRLLKILYTALNLKNTTKSDSKWHFTYQALSVS